MTDVSAFAAAWCRIVLPSRSRAFTSAPRARQRSKPVRRASRAKTSVLQFRQPVGSAKRP